MPNFKRFANTVSENFAKLAALNDVLYVVNISGDTLYLEYLKSFPDGTNPIHKERPEYDCNTCKNFIRNIGNIVTIKNDELISVWDTDFEKLAHPFNEIAKRLSTIIKSADIVDVFFVTELAYGCSSNSVILGDGSVVTYNHFRANIPAKFLANRTNTPAALKSAHKTTVQMLEKSIKEISVEAIDIVLELIDQNSLYRGAESKSLLESFKNIHKEYTKSTNKNIFLWSNSNKGLLSSIKNTAIGVLLVDISGGCDLDVAISKFEKIMAPANYKRPKPIFTQKMIKDAEKTINDLGLTESLGRRHAVPEDISVEHVLFVDRDVAKKMSGGLMDVIGNLAQDKPIKEIKSKIEEISIDDFVSKIVPQISSMEVLFEGKHTGNLVNLIAPINKDSAPLFKWPNNFSWAYNNDLADSTKELVKSFGGNVNGVLRFSIRWNDDGVTNSDYDAMCIEPDGNMISFRSKTGKTGGVLDVDIVNPSNKVAVENITWQSFNKMVDGIYKFSINCFSKRNGTGGFSAEIEYNGEIYQFNHPTSLKQGETVDVATIQFSKLKGIKFLSALKSTNVSREVWGISTHRFIPVSMLTFSPNYWNGSQIGNKHYFFILKNCKNDSSPRGFFNEYLRNDLNDHRKVFEALSNKMRVADSDNQLAGLGFSSTQKDSVTVRVNGNFSRTLLVKF